MWIRVRGMGLKICSSGGSRLPRFYPSLDPSLGVSTPYGVNPHANIEGVWGFLRTALAMSKLQRNSPGQFARLRKRVGRTKYPFRVRTDRGYGLPGPWCR